MVRSLMRSFGNEAGGCGREPGAGLVVRVCEPQGQGVPVNQSASSLFMKGVCAQTESQQVKATDVNHCFNGVPTFGSFGEQQ